MSVSVVARATALVVALAFAPTAFAAPPKASGPTNLRITASSKTSLTLAWDAAKNTSSSWWYTAPSNLRVSSETSAPEIWLDWDAASDDTDAPGELLDEVHVNGARVSTAIGNVEDIVYCQVTGETRIAVRAIDTSGNVSAFSSEIVFVC